MERRGRGLAWGCLLVVEVAVSGMMGMTKTGLRCRRLEEGDAVGVMKKKMNSIFFKGENKGWWSEICGYGDV